VRESLLYSIFSSIVKTFYKKMIIQYPTTKTRYLSVGSIYFSNHHTQSAEKQTRL